MSILVILESKGDPQRLLDAAAEVARSAGVAEGLLARVLAPTDDGTVLVSVWESEEARVRWHENPAHRKALEDAGIAQLASERVVREFQAHYLELRPAPR